MVRTVAMTAAMFMIQEKRCNRHVMCQVIELVELVAGDVTDEFMGGGRD